MLPTSVALMVDYNQTLTVQEAIRRGRALDGEGLYWIEEPIRHDDFTGCAEIARTLATPVQIGENFSLVHDMERALDAQSCDYVMPDLERIGGITGWRRAAELLGDRPLSRVRKAVLTAVSKPLHAQARKDEARYNPLIAIQWGCVTHHASGSRL